MRFTYRLTEPTTGIGTANRRAGYQVSSSQFLTCCDEADEVEQGVAGLDEFVQSGFVDAQVCEELWSFFVVEVGKFASRSRNCPYDGWESVCWPRAEK